MNPRAAFSVGGNRKTPEWSCPSMRKTQTLGENKSPIFFFVFTQPHWTGFYFVREPGSLPRFPLYFVKWMFSEYSGKYSGVRGMSSLILGPINPHFLSAAKHWHWKTRISRTHRNRPISIDHVTFPRANQCRASWSIFWTWLNLVTLHYETRNVSR